MYYGNYHVFFGNYRPIMGLTQIMHDDVMADAREVAESLADGSGIVGGEKRPDLAIEFCQAIRHTINPEGYDNTSTMKALGLL